MSTSSSAKTLLAEEDALIAMSIREVLSLLGYEVVGVAATVNDAPCIAQNSRPDLAIFDTASRAPAYSGPSWISQWCSSLLRLIRVHGPGPPPSNRQHTYASRQARSRSSPPLKRRCGKTRKPPAELNGGPSTSGGGGRRECRKAAMMIACVPPPKFA